MSTGYGSSRSAWGAGDAYIPTGGKRPSWSWRIPRGSPRASQCSRTSPRHDLTWGRLARARLGRRSHLGDDALLRPGQRGDPEQDHADGDHDRRDLVGAVEEDALVEH